MALILRHTLKEQVMLNHLIASKCEVLFGKLVKIAKEK
jgi:hypothetical protein